MAKEGILNIFYVFINLSFKTMQGSLQYKQIMEKYKLSPEHPGLAVNPTLNSTTLSPVKLIGLQGLPMKIHQWGPRFFDKPLNEGIFEKIACAAKYTAIFSELFLILLVIFNSLGNFSDPVYNGSYSCYTINSS